MRNRIFILSFAIIILAPIVLDVFGFLNDDSNAASIPKLSLKSIKSYSNPIRGAYVEAIVFKDKFDKHYNENFKLKKSLLPSFNFIKSKVFHVDVLPRKVVSGKDGWMFLGNSYSDVILESRGLKVFNQQELDSIRLNLQSVSSFVEENDAKFYLAIAPNKHQIYGDKLFNSNFTGTTKRKQIMENLEAIDFSLIDLSAGFDTISSLLFYKTNTHWNDLGAYWGYRNLVNVFSKNYPQVKPISFDEIEIKDTITFQEDLTRMLDINVEEHKQIYSINPSTASPLPKMLKEPEGFGREPGTYEYRYRSSANKLKIILFRDSFSDALKKYIIETFGESVIIYSYKFDKTLIENEQPDIVLYEIIERNLDELKRLSLN